jgi:dienelactone hydrolase
VGTLSRAWVSALLAAGVALAAAPTASADLASLQAACTKKDAADGDITNGADRLPFYFCDDGVPDAGGRTPNPTGASAIEVPAKYQGFLGLPGEAEDAADVPGADPDGNIALDVDLSLPNPTTPEPAGGYPLVVFMHGCCGGWKKDWEAEDVFAAGSSEKWHHSSAWFASRGYAVLTYTARGFVDGDGHGSTGETQLDSRRFEINDYQHLAGQLADATFTVGGQTVRIDGSRVVTIGGSYGGGFSWLALTDPTWKSPGGKDMRLVATTPKYGWTDLAYSLVPNGAHLEDRLQAFDGSDTRTPIGHPKQGIVAGLYASGKTGVPPGSRHTTFPSEIDTGITCLQAPLPIEANPFCDPVINSLLPEFIHDRSAYYQNAFFTGIANRTIDPVPVYSAGTLTDPLFPGREHRRMVERLKAARSDYPVQQYFGDYQHFVQNKRKEWSDLCGADRHVCTLADYPAGDLNAEPSNLTRSGINDDLSDFVDHYAKPPADRAAPTPPLNVTSSLQICPANASRAFPLDEPGPRFTATTFEGLAPNTLKVIQTGEQRTTSKAVPNQHAAQADPVANQVANNRQCPKATGPAGAGVASYDSPALPRTFTMIGPTRVTVPYGGAGSELQLNARLYDVFPDGTAVMVDRGFRTLTAASGNAVFDLLGNGWRFEQGHMLRVELAQDDGPYIKPSVTPSSLALSGVTLEIPVREASATLGATAPESSATPARNDENDGDAPSDNPEPRRAAGLRSAAGGGDLPFTGFPLLPFLVAGAALVGTGAALRRRMRTPGQPERS